jgi:hypothetical protein
VTFGGTPPYGLKHWAQNRPAYLFSSRPGTLRAPFQAAQNAKARLLGEAVERIGRP